MIKDLQLIWTKHPGKEYADRKYVDFIISGQLLWKYLGLKNNSNVTAFGFFPEGEQQRIALKEFRLQQKTQLPGERIALYICTCCGDIGCGAITAKIIDKGDKIAWTAFAYQSDPDEPGEIFDVSDIEFDRQQYFKAFSSIK